MSSFEHLDKQGLTPQTTSLSHLWGKESHKDFLSANNSDCSNTRDKEPQFLACDNCHQKDKQDDSSVESQLKLKTTVKIEKDSHFGDTRVPKTIWLLVDDSGSMNDHIRDDNSETKIDAITDAFQEYLPQIPEGTLVGLATLSLKEDDKKSPVLKVLVDPGLNTRDEIVRQMKHREPDGGTPIKSGFEQLKARCYQANGTASYPEPIEVIYGGDGGETCIKEGEKDACAVIQEWLGEKPENVAVKAIGIGLEKNTPASVAEAAYRLFDCLNGSKAVNAHTSHDILNVLMSTPGTIPITNPDVETSLRGKLLHLDAKPAATTQPDVHTPQQP